MHENNPCRCGAQAKSLIGAGMVDPENLVLDLAAYGTIREITGKTIGELEVLVDNETSKENVSRAASGQGWSVADVLEENNEFTLKLTKR